MTRTRRLRASLFDEGGIFTLAELLLAAGVAGLFLQDWLIGAALGLVMALACIGRGTARHRRVVFVAAWGVALFAEGAYFFSAEVGLVAGLLAALVRLAIRPARSRRADHLPADDRLTGVRADA